MRPQAEPAPRNRVRSNPPVHRIQDTLGTVVEFRAFILLGQAAVTPPYLWPDATPVDDEPSDPSEPNAPPPPPPLPGPDVDVGIAIDAGQGPFGGPPVAVDNRLYGMNIANWRRNDYDPPDPTFVAFLSALRPGVFRWSAGHSSQEYIWEGGGPSQTGCRQRRAHDRRRPEALDAGGGGRPRALHES